MKLIIIYGAPAAGKLTIATEVARRTGFKLFHNHVSIDCVRPVFDFGSPPFLRMIETIRFAMIAEAAREGVGLIHTFVYASGEDWVVWLNGQRVTPEAVPKQIIDIQVKNDYIELKWFDSWTNLIYPVRLRPHQRFNLDTRIFLPGTAAL